MLSRVEDESATKDPAEQAAQAPQSSAPSMPGLLREMRTMPGSLPAKGLSAPETRT